MPNNMVPTSNNIRIMINISCLQGLLPGWKFRHTDILRLQTAVGHHIAREMKFQGQEVFTAPA
jgi:hypothetical protein